MSPTMRAALLGAAAVTVFDAIAAAAARYFGFPYGNAALGSWLIYAAVGFAAVRLGAGIGGGVAAGALTALADATLGWAVSWVMGPGRPPGGALTPGMWAAAAASVIAMGAVVACLGATVGAFVRPRRTPAT